MKIEFNELADRELSAAHDFYEGNRAGLGSEFVAEVSNGLAKISDMPNAWPMIRPGIRRYLLDRFPYGLVYLVRSQKIRILAVAHLRRKPGFWRGRK